MSDLKTQPTGADVNAFLAGVEDETKRADCQTVLRMMERATGSPPEMFGSSIVGFGRYAYTYASGRSGEWFVCGFSPRKQALTLYIMPGFSQYEGLLARLGKHRTGKSCLYIKRLSDIDIEVLDSLIVQSVAAMRKKYESA